MAGTYEQATIGEPNSSAAPKWLAQFKGTNEALDASNKLEAKSLSLGALGRFYKPSIIATEQERENVAFGKLTTPDEVTGVVLPENGLILVSFRARTKTSVSGAGKIGLFLGSNPVKLANGEKEMELTGPASTAIRQVSTSTGNEGFTWPNSEAATADATTGQIACVGTIPIFAAAGTYTVSVQWAASSGKIAVKERKLWVGVVSGV